MQLQSETEENKNFDSEEKSAKIGRTFGKLNRKFEEKQVQRHARELGMSYFDLSGFPIEEDVLAVIEKSMAEDAMTVPFDKDGGLLKLAVVDPTSVELEKLSADLRKKKYTLEYYLVSESGLREALKQYGRIVFTGDRRIEESKIIQGKEVVEKFRSLSATGVELENIKTTDLVAMMIGSAVTMNASDIHIEPGKNQIKVRFRVDGVLQDIVTLPKLLNHGLISRLKLISGLKLNVTSAPQDGRFTMVVNNNDLEIRISILPSSNGESVVMRLLGVQMIEIKLESLGLRERDYNLVKRELKKPNGMIVTTGPTGSGKTTTLYAFLNYLNRAGVKIITLEDPVEYQLEGIVQTAINKKGGLDFAAGLRSILRQDPDIVMVGEIRDLETVETASQAALTGHVVLSTIHTNDAAGAIPRFIDLGVKPVTLAPALNAVIAQRLLRKICTHCKQSYEPEQKELELVKKILDTLSEDGKKEIPEHLRFYHSKGCEECHGLGYKGRVGVFEIFSVDDEIEQLIFQQAPAHQIKKIALKQGMLSMQQDAVLKALAGETDLAEVWRVTEE